jgi:hypothetical protein
LEIKPKIDITTNFIFLKRWIFNIVVNWLWKKQIFPLMKYAN